LFYNEGNILLLLDFDMLAIFWSASDNLGRKLPSTFRINVLLKTPIFCCSPTVH